MKRYFATLLVMAFAAVFTQHASARISINIRYDNYREYLDLQAVATAFSKAGDIEEFEYRLNDPRDLISNLDLNNDGFVDYLRVEQYSERHEHVIYIQAVLDRNYSKTVATIYVGRDRFNDEYIQIVGDESIYGYNYIIEPVYRRRPVIVRWLWTWNSPRYSSPYYWGYYPNHYRVHHIIALPAYHNRVKRYVDHRHEYRRIEKNNRRDDRYNRPDDRRVERNNRTADRDNRGQVDRRPDSAPGRSSEVQRSNNSSSREATREATREVSRESNRESNRESVRETRSTPQRTAPASSGNSRSSGNSHSSGNDNRNNERR